jgi:hypothetical protein
MDIERRCDVCAGPTKSGIRHIHELEPGEAAHIAGSRRLVEVESVGPGRVQVYEERDPEKVEFQAQGKRVTFTRSRGGTTILSPFTEVEPI